MKQENKHLHLVGLSFLLFSFQPNCYNGELSFPAASFPMGFSEHEPEKGVGLKRGC